ncbi:hypothetical protein GJ496_006088 [Pomphorhynchus laevis]|nr:hypothetical protein GJ496_006088 [Pomphorhynchus laevis]
MTGDTSRPKIIVTGGLGYVGSHCALQLVKQGYSVIIIDNLQNSCAQVYNRLITMLKLPPKNDMLNVFEIDMLDLQALKVVFDDSVPVTAVIHLAGLKSVGESVLDPVKYYKNNLVSTINLLECMDEFKVDKLIFSSSATVYGLPEHLPITESHRIGQNLTNTYGQTKFMIEQMLQDLVKSQQIRISQLNQIVKNDMTPISVTILRYFNPVGSDTSGLIGECPIGTPANLMPYVCQVAAGQRPVVNVYGNNYDTPDGTGIRDYVHVTDLALGHVAALKYMSPSPCIEVYNLGTGKGYSVLEMITAMEKASGRKIPITIKERRDGDIASCYCDPSKAEKCLNWKATRTLDDMCKDLWNWQLLNPQGYATA